MKLASFLDTPGPRLAAWYDGGYLDLAAADPSLPADMKSLLAAGPEMIVRAGKAVRSAPLLATEGLRLLPPLPNPQKVICIGLNYRDHARESGATIPDEPVTFCKFPTALRADGDPIELPPVAHEVDYEAELVVVIGQTARHVSRDAALQYVAGYTCGNDVSARDWQKGKPGGQWLLGKTFDSFAPLGPHLVTADDVPDPGNLRIRCRLNGQVMQDSNTRELIFSVPELISYVSQVCTLLPGDLIFTGTPAGVGIARKPPVLLGPGDRVEVQIEGIGLLSNPVVAGGGNVLD